MTQTQMTKTQEIRLKEVLEIYRKLKELGLSDEVCNDLKEFRRIANTFVKEGYSTQGKIPLPEIGRVLIYHFTMVPHLESSVNLVASVKDKIVI